MAAHENVAALERAVGAFNTGDLDGYMDAYADDVALHGYPPGVEGKEGARAFYAGFLAALPDRHIEIHEALTEGDLVAVRFSLSGTQEGELMGVPATGRRIEVHGQSFFRFDDRSQIAERWQAMDAMDLLAQLGALPEAGATT